MSCIASNQRLLWQQGVLTAGARRYFNGCRHTLVGCTTLASRLPSSTTKRSLRRQILPTPSVSHFQHLSTQVESTEDESPNDHEIVLYMRNTERVKLSRKNFAFSCSFSAFSIWFSGYLTPFVNAAEQMEVEIDPLAGYAALAIAGSTQLIFTLYPKRCISKMTVTLGTPQTPPKIRIYDYTLPLIDESLEPREYNLGEVAIKPEDATNLFFSSPLEVGHYYLQIPSDQNSWLQTNVLDLWNEKDVPEPELLMNLLMQPQLAARELERRREQQRQGRPYRPPERDENTESPLQNIVRNARLRNRR